MHASSTWCVATKHTTPPGATAQWRAEGPSLQGWGPGGEASRPGVVAQAESFTQGLSRSPGEQLLDNSVP